MLDTIISTVGRTELERTLESIIYNNGFDVNEDKIYVISDGIDLSKFPKNVKNYIQKYDCIEFAVLGPTNDLGVSQKNYGMYISQNPYIMFIDDDDIYVDNAFTIVKDTIKKCPEQYYIFKMIYGSLTGQDVLWREKKIKFQNIGVSMFVVHRGNRYTIPPWGSRFGSDFDFIDMYSKLNKDKKCIWVDEIISIFRPII